MKTIVAFSLLLVAVLGNQSFDATWDESEILEGIEKRIIGGKTAKPNQFPHQVRLHLIKQVNGHVVSSLCGGAIISDKVIITAAHCLKGALGGILYLGITNIRTIEPTRAVVKLAPEHFIIHEKYESFEDDLALIKLPTSIKFNDGTKAIRLPSANIGNIENRMGVISGYGKLGDKLPPSDKLQFVERQILPGKFCRISFMSYIQATQICVDGSDRKSACPGDSGGPLVITEDDGIETLVGVTSYGRMTCELGFPAVYTRLSAYLNWIHKHTGIPIRY